MGGNGGTVSLKDASKFAIDFLAKDEDGFVLMIEQAHVDKYSHKNDFGNMVKAMKALNDTIAMILDWIGDRNDTAIIVTADHETGGLSVSKQNNLPNRYDCASGTVYYAWERNRTPIRTSERSSSASTSKWRIIPISTRNFCLKTAIFPKS